MSDLLAEDWQREMKVARDALHRRFPDLSCLRCRQEKFLMRLWPDESLVPGVADEKNNRIVELICENCGLQEKHVVNILVADAST